MTRTPAGRLGRCLGFLLVSILCAVSSAAADPATALPPRPAGAPGGSVFLEQTRFLTRAKREAKILEQISAGNLPDFLRTMVPVQTAVVIGGVTRTCTFWVTPDYLALGDDTDFVRIPMGSRTAQKVADLAGCSLPTRRMVDLVWKAAPVKLSPQPIPPGPAMMSNAYIGLHQKKVETQRKGKPLGALTAGHKKDVVISNRLLSAPLRVAIYGWHWLSGKPIQPLSTVHEHSYADYSHGIRLVWGTVLVDGTPMAISDVLESPTLHKLLSDEGPMPAPRVPGVTPP